MAGIITEDYSISPRSAVTEGMTSEQRCQSGDSIAEWRSSEQVENGTPSTSPLYWDSDDDDDCGPKPSELYGRFTWKIENFSTINKRELRSNAFEVGGYKWYILIYPQGCDVCNHLSLFLCVANHDKLLPGWSHFAQFTIAVVNKDPKKSKYSDTLHRFWKKEHDWGWKKFMELSKVYDGFIVADTLVIKAQVQVIREKAHRPFRCLDCQYRRELVRVYLSNVEQICRRFVEERRDKLKKLIEDKLRWSSFRAFWISIDANSRRRMSRDKTDVILKVVVKHFFVEKEVTSTLVMDSLYSGLKALECQSKNKKGREKLIDLEELPAPMVRVVEDMFVLADDVLSLLERAAFEPLPHQPLPPKDDKCSQNRTKEGSSGEEFNKDSIERDERRLMELGRRTVETFVLAHIFSRIEVSYQEAVALKRQEELIREEEAAWQAENELKAKRGANEKEKRAKKKQAKQKRNSRKGKDKGKDERSDVVEEKVQPVGPSDNMILDDFHPKSIESTIEKSDTVEVASDLSDNGVDVVKVLQHDLDDRDSSPTNWDTDTSEIHQTLEASCSDVQNGQTEKRSQSVMDDSSSTCSTDSVPSVVMNGPFKGRSLPNNQNHSSSNRGKSQRSKETRERSSAHAINNQSDAAIDDAPSSVTSESKVSAPESEAVELSLKNDMQQIQKHVLVKDVEVLSLHKKLSAKDHVDEDRSSKSKTTETSLSPGKKLPYVVQQPKESPEFSSNMTNTMAEVSSSSEPPSNSGSQSEKLIPLSSKLPPVLGTSTSETLKPATPVKNTTAQNVNALSRPSSAPLIPAPRPTAPVVSTVQTSPLLSRSVSAAGRLGTEPSPSAPSYVPQSYRNAIIGKSAMTVGTAVSTHQAASSGQGLTYSQPPSTFLTSALMLPPQPSVRSDQTPGKLGFTFGSIKPEVVRNRSLLRDGANREAAGSSGRYSSDLASNMEKLDLYGELQKRQYSVENASRVAPYQAQGVVSDEFPHLDIINDLLDEEQTNGNTVNGYHHTFNRQYSFPGHASSMDVGTLTGSFRFDQSEQYYDECFQRSYGSLSTIQRSREGHFSQMDLSAYANSQTEGLMQNRWPYGHADPSTLNAGNGDVNGYSYQLMGYSSLSGGVNGYLYPPSNGP